MSLATKGILSREDFAKLKGASRIVPRSSDPLRVAMALFAVGKLRLTAE